MIHMSKAKYFDANYIEMVTKIKKEELCSLIDSGTIKGYKKASKVYVESTGLVELLKKKGKYVADVFRVHDFSVVVVDDDTNITSSLKRLLATFDDIIINTANNAFELGKILNYRVPDLVILDYNMPGFDGKEILKMLKDSQDTFDIKVIVYSGFVPDDVYYEMKELGVNEIIIKSSDFTPLVDRIQAHIKITAY